MTGLPPDERPLGIRGLLGLGLDDDSGHIRITRSAKFVAYGGSQETHEHIVEVGMKFGEKVDERGKPLSRINARELREIGEELREHL
jgi:hypothetical protein